jgi:hypothetical protein
MVKWGRFARGADRQWPFQGTMFTEWRYALSSDLLIRIGNHPEGSRRQAVAPESSSENPEVTRAPLRALGRCLLRHLDAAPAACDDRRRVQVLPRRRAQGRQDRAGFLRTVPKWTVRRDAAARRRSTTPHRRDSHRARTGDARGRVQRDLRRRARLDLQTDTQR